MSEKETSKSKRIEEILSTLLPDQLRFIVARLQTRTDKAAAEEIGIAPDTVYGWPNKDQMDEAILLINAEPIDAAREIRKKNLVKAMMVKAKGLDSKDERLAQAAATEIIEWELGKAKMPVEHSGEVDTSVKIVEVIKRED